jgi:hypothetical protein
LLTGVFRSEDELAEWARGNGLAYEVPDLPGKTESGKKFFNTGRRPAHVGFAREPRQLSRARSRRAYPYFNFIQTIAAPSTSVTALVTMMATSPLRKP